MKKTRRRCDREIKIPAVAEIRYDKPLAQIAREQGIHPGGAMNWLRIPK